MLAGQGFKDVINMAGGIKAWNSDRAMGPEDLGLDLFTGQETPSETLIVAYSLEEGLREFYVSMIPEVKNDNARQLFEKLSIIEVKHQDRIFAEYCKITGTEENRDEFEKKVKQNRARVSIPTERRC